MEKGKSDIRKRSYAFSLDIVKLIKVLPNDMVSRTIGGQLLRSATSIGADIIEAQAGSSKKDFINYLNIALKSANESVYWLNLIKDSGIGERESINSLEEEGKQLAKILGSSLVTLRNKDNINNP